MHNTEVRWKIKYHLNIFEDSSQHIHINPYPQMYHSSFNISTNLNCHLFI